MRNDYIYDVETYPNVFTFTCLQVSTGNYWVYEISEFKNQIGELLAFLWWLASQPNARMVGFNNEHFDYPVIHEIMRCGDSINVMQIYAKAQAALKSNNFDHNVWESDRFIPQVDLFKIHHFDNIAKATSLKVIEFNMRSEIIEDLPFPPGTYLTEREIRETLIPYNIHDVTETKKFYEYTLPAIEFREKLSASYGRNIINYNDTKIGKEHLIQNLEKAAPGSCYVRGPNGRQPRQTIRHSMRIGDFIFPYIQFNNPDLIRFKDWLSNQIIKETKGVFKDLNVTVNGFQFDFGTGGLHGSIDSSIIESSDSHVILDLDVEAFYPSLAIVNRLRPEHLGELFVAEYSALRENRRETKKGSPENGALKLALNGGYGDTNSVYSPLYDPQFTMSVTINGQLLLCMLAEQMMLIPSVRMIQANTDGITIYCRRDYIEHVNAVRQWWESLTCLNLEEVIYNRMFIRDVNNYIAEGVDGKIKRKGAYAYETPMENPSTQELEWNKNHSARVVAMAAEAALLHGQDIRQFIVMHGDIYDFMLRTKVPRNSRLIWRLDDLGDYPLQNVTRYYISNEGGALYKIMPPLSGKQNEREMAINKGWLTTPVNNINSVTRFDFNYDWYVLEAEKLVNKLKRFQ